MPGITRFDITNKPLGRGAYRFTDSRKRWPMANDLYRYIFEVLHMPLLPDDDLVKCSLDEFKAGYDYELGIDVILAFDNGMQMTMQEKFLYTTFSTVTVEYMNDPNNGQEGDWFNMKANWYFVGYDSNKDFEWNEWVLLDWPATKLLTMRGAINWYEKPNKQDGAKATFKYAPIKAFPSDCVVACSHDYRFSNYPRGNGNGGQLPLLQTI